MDFHFTVKLKQHTPLIHFQHDQAGATLRATEVKAKLDKFLINKKGGWNDVPASWKILTGAKENPEALDYKIRINTGEIVYEDIEKKRFDPRKGKEVTDTFPCFFANLGEKDAKEQKRFSYSRGDIEVKFFAFNQELLDFIQQNSNEFFIRHNFGSRQSKGFGCFLPVDLNMSQVPSDFYYFTVNSNNDRTIFATIDLFYKTLRGGVNGASHPQQQGFEKGIYLKPMIFLYAASDENKIEWEKRAIKQQLFKSKLNKHQIDHPLEPNFEPSPLHHEAGEKRARIVRDWLGLSTDQTWKDYPQDRRDEQIKKIEVDKAGKEKAEKDAIARMKSPLLFKPVKINNRECRVYFCAENKAEVVNTFKNARFKITSNSSGNLTLDVWKEFDLNNFLEFAFAQGRIESAISIDPEKGHSDKAESIKNEIIRIYKEIRKNKSNHA